MAIVSKYGTRVNLKCERYREEGRTASLNRLICHFQLARLERNNSQSMIKFKIQKCKHSPTTTSPPFLPFAPNSFGKFPTCVYELREPPRETAEVKGDEFNQPAPPIGEGQEPGYPQYLSRCRNSTSHGPFRNASR